MINKKLYLMLVCTLLSTNVFSSIRDTFTGGHGSKKPSRYSLPKDKVLIPSLALLDANDQLKQTESMQLTTPYHIDHWIERVADTTDFYVKQISKKHKILKDKVLSGNNSSDFISKYSDLKNKYSLENKDIQAILKTIDMESENLKEAATDWGKAVGVGLFVDNEAKVKAVSECQKYIGQVADNLKKLEDIASQISAIVSLFNVEANVDAANEAARKAKEEVKIVQAEVITASQAAAAAAGGSSEVKAEENLKETEEKLEDARALANKKEADAVKAEANLQDKKAEQVITNIQEVISKIAELRDSSAKQKTAIDGLIEKIKNNKSNYSPKIISYIDDIIIPEMTKIIKTIDIAINAANKALGRLTELSAQKDSLSAEKGGSLQKQIERDDKIDELIKSLKIQFNLVSRILKEVQIEQDKLSNLHSEMQQNESLHRITRKVDPKEIERTLELVHAVKIEVEGMMRMRSEKQKEMIARTLDLSRAVKVESLAATPRALELAHAVKLAAPTASQATTAAAGGDDAEGEDIRKEIQPSSRPVKPLDPRNWS